MPLFDYWLERFTATLANARVWAPGRLLVEMVKNNALHIHEKPGSAHETASLELLQRGAAIGRIDLALTVETERKFIFCKSFPANGERFEISNREKSAFTWKRWDTRSSKQRKVTGSATACLQVWFDVIIEIKSNNIYFEVSLDGTPDEDCIDEERLSSELSKSTI